MASPLHQFEVQPIIPFEIGGLNLAFTNSSLWMMIAAIVSISFLSIASSKRALVPGRLQLFAEDAYQFIANMVRENTGSGGMHYFPLMFTLFMIVFLGNALGLLPFSFTYTSQLVITAALACVVFFSVLIIGLYKHGTHFFHLFLPPGVPILLAPLIIPIELISFLVRPVTLSVRLFANMMAGHILLKVLAGFSVGMVSMGFTGYVLGILPMLFNVILIGFELLIAFLQAFVFTVLSCIYLKDTVELSH